MSPVGCSSIPAPRTAGHGTSMHVGIGTLCHHPARVIPKQQPPSSPAGDDSLEKTQPQVGSWPSLAPDFSGLHPPLSKSKTPRPWPSQVVIPDSSPQRPVFPKCCLQPHVTSHFSRQQLVVNRQIQKINRHSFIMLHSFQFSQTIKLVNQSHNFPPINTRCDTF